MKKYLADLLTLMRFLLALYLINLALFGGSIETAFIVFVIGELTDAFDGTCAKRWPFPKDKIPKYRRYAEKYDMFSDILLIGGMMLFLTMHINLILGIAVLAILTVSCSIIELIAYGKFLGHPDDCRPNSLYAKNPKLAERILLARRLGIYIPSVAILVIVMIFSTSWDFWIQVSLLGFGIAVGFFLWSFQRVRRQKVARD